MKTQKQNEPQLSAEMRKQLKFAMANIFISYEALGKKVSAENVEKVVKHFLATALEEQEEKHRDRRTKWAFKTVNEAEKARAEERQRVIAEVEGVVDKMPVMTLTNPANNNPANAFKLIDKSELRAKLAHMKGKE